MRRIVLGLAALGVLVLSTSLVPVGAQWLTMPGYRFETTLIVQALPLEAEVLVDGQRLGTAQDLTAVAIAVTPGSHVLRITAPGYVAYTGRFVADPGSSVSQFHVTLAPR